ncbi:hypothetical protein [Marivirga lumbricoides]|uniref:hypothetical protein n=1 Tax=Marivirga lumbricoides TaxID=1046115 RepID=UPI003CD064BC
MSGIISLLADSPIEDEFVWILRNIGIDKILTGSDFPQRTLEETVNAVMKLDLTPTEQSKILYGNAASLINIKEQYS